MAADRYSTSSESAAMPRQYTPAGSTGGERKGKAAEVTGAAAAVRRVTLLGAVEVSRTAWPAVCVSALQSKMPTTKFMMQSSTQMVCPGLQVLVPHWHVNESMLSPHIGGQGPPEAGLD